MKTCFTFPVIPSSTPHLGRTTQSLWDGTGTRALFIQPLSPGLNCLTTKSVTVLLVSIKTVYLHNINRFTKNLQHYRQLRQLVSNLKMHQTLLSNHKLNIFMKLKYLLLKIKYFKILLRNCLGVTFLHGIDHVHKSCVNRREFSYKS